MKMMRNLETGETPEARLSSFDLDGIVKHIVENDAKNIVFMLGAGCSVAAGIPDFRSPGTGLYDNLSKYDLPHPQAIFSLDFLQERPEAFFTLAKELWPGNYMPTAAHYFLKVLNDSGRLLRCYTQNIDGLESLTGLPEDKCFAAHGNFYGAHCTDCSKAHPTEFVKEHVFGGTVPRCRSCDGIVKPDIVFFGEALPENFGFLSARDFRKCDLLIVAGTSLTVHPFASLVEEVSATTPRLVINNPRVGEELGMVFEGEKLYRDVHVGGDLQVCGWVCGVEGVGGGVEGLVD